MTTFPVFSSIIIILLLLWVAALYLKLGELRREKELTCGERADISPQIKEKELKKQKIIQYLKEVDKITNDEVEKLVGVADSTATKYLQELEEEGKIVQHGESGRGVHYVLK